MKTLFILFLVLFIAVLSATGQTKFESDVFKTTSGKFVISCIGHGTLMIEFNGKVIHIDPWSQLADYKTLPKADIILITHHHTDHLDTNAIASISKKSTQIVSTTVVYDIINKGIIMKNGDKKTVEGFGIEAVSAYNTTEGRGKFHPKGRDNGYVLTIVGKRIYIAGDTENIPEMSKLKNIDIAFLPMNQPYTMLPEQVMDAVNKFHPKILYPYHYGETDVSALEKLILKDTEIELRIRSLK